MIVIVQLKKLIEIIVVARIIIVVFEGVINQSFWRHSLTYVLVKRNIHSFLNDHLRSIVKLDHQNSKILQPSFYIHLFHMILNDLVLLIL
jgi:hypothetical protein